MAKYGFVVNTKRCFGCRTCMVACKMEHNVALGAFRSKLLNSKGTMDYDTYEGTWPDIKLSFRFANCQQCDNPPCVENCPTGATVKGGDGIVTVDKDVCIGCETCIASCPYDARTLDGEAGVIEKCDMCQARLADGAPPMCVYVCPARALHHGDLEDPDSEVAKLIATVETSRLLVDEGTGPNVHYIK